MGNYLITYMVFTPLLGVLLNGLSQGLSSKKKALDFERWISLTASLTSCFLAIVLVSLMNADVAELQAVERLPWISSYAITYDMGVDGLNALLILAISVVFPVLIATEWDQRVGLRGMHGLFLVMQTAFLGAVCSQDLFLQFFFWALSSLPFFFLIGIWGGEERERAAFGAVVASAVGNAMFFMALVLIYYSVDPHTFSLERLAGGKLSATVFEMLGYEISVPWTAFGLMSAGLALRTPIWPFHGWFTEAAKQAPSSVFVALSAISVPVSTYVFLRDTYTLFPETVSKASVWLVAIGVVNLLVGGICACAQRELKRLQAFVCVSEVGLILVGIGSLNSAGMVGAVCQQLTMALALAGFGLFSGLVERRVGHGAFSEMGGIAMRAPAAALFAAVFVASLLGFPGAGGFVSRALLIVGGYTVHPLIVALTGIAFVLATYYFLSMYRSMFLSKPSGACLTFPDLTPRERLYMAPLACGLLFLGVYPKPLIELIRPTLLTLLSTIK